MLTSFCPQKGYFVRKNFADVFIDNISAFPADNLDDVSDDLTYTTTVDHDISRVENLLDQWTAELKKNILVIFMIIVMCRHFYMCSKSNAFFAM